MDVWENLNGSHKRNIKISLSLDRECLLVDRQVYISSALFILRFNLPIILESSLLRNKRNSEKMKVYGFIASPPSRAVEISKYG